VEEPELTKEVLERINNRIPWFFYIMSNYINGFNQDIEEIRQLHGDKNHWEIFRNGQQNAFKEAWSLLLGD
jgi:ABC-type maltose transport system permease subunit